MDEELMMSIRRARKARGTGWSWPYGRPADPPGHPQHHYVKDLDGLMFCDKCGDCPEEEEEA